MVYLSQAVPLLAGSRLGSLWLRHMVLLIHGPGATKPHPGVDILSIEDV